MLIGPSKAGALLEGSKERAKEFMMDHQIPTAVYQSFTKETLKEGKLFSQPSILSANILSPNP